MVPVTRSDGPRCSTTMGARLAKPESPKRARGPDGGDRYGPRMTPAQPSLDYPDHLARESARFSAALLEADADAPVPTCPGWDADDLLWHLADVQWFWGTIVRRRLLQAAETRALVHPERPT